MISHGFGIFSSLGLPKMVMFTYRKKLLIQPTKKDDKRIENSVYRFGKQLWTYQVMIAIFMRKSQKTNAIACVHRDSCCTEKIWLSYDFFFLTLNIFKPQDILLAHEHIRINWRKKKKLFASNGTHWITKKVKICICINTWA